MQSVMEKGPMDSIGAVVQDFGQRWQRLKARVLEHEQEAALEERASGRRRLRRKTTPSTDVNEDEAMILD